MSNKGKKRSKQPKAMPGNNVPKIEDLDDEFEQGNADSSSSFPEQCSNLRKNGYVLLKNKPCKIVDMMTSSPGKHGHAKVHLVGIDIFTGKKHEDISPASHNMQVPNVKRLEYQVVNVSHEGYLSLMDDKGALRSDLKVEDDDLGNEIKDRFRKEEIFMVTVISAMDEEKVIATKNIKQP